ncbi:VQ motif-containing protein 9 [Hibiscus syriacus]|uniref:VQ motif-containing protein 9 n=1 Tax=Hibiscus syriacus TaxID=106335 RepID=A0A6A3BSE8_HIBSY|nr:VQ motif-containing protein 9-like [Hibiscus syriacus]KAE8719554.1 VQ motif-containing protein 9 [Hibiscus syriacus]
MEKSCQSSGESWDVVQKLTGSPAHERFSTPPPIHQPKPQSSRLQRIRPPPLAHVTNRPPPVMNCAVPNMNPSGCLTANTFMNQRPPATAPLSPLPPFPAVQVVAESPVSAFMRYLQNSTPTAVDPNPKQFTGFPPLAPLVSPLWNNLTAPQQQPAQQSQVPTTGIIQSYSPSSSVALGCVNSPRSPYSSFFYPFSGQLGFPLSPSPKWPSL